MAIFNSYVSLPEGNHLKAHGIVQNQPNVDLFIENDGRCWHLTRNDGERKAGDVFEPNQINVA